MVASVNCTETIADMSVLYRPVWSHQQYMDRNVLYKDYGLSTLSCLSRIVTLIIKNITRLQFEFRCFTYVCCSGILQGKDTLVVGNAMIWRVKFKTYTFSADMNSWYSICVNGIAECTYCKQARDKNQMLESRYVLVDDKYAKIS